MLSAAISKVLGAFFKIPLTNLLGGVGMGYFSCAYGLFLPIYALSATGLSAAVAKLTAEYAARGCFNSVRRVRNTSRLIFLGLGAALTLLIIFLSKPFAIYTSGDTSSWYSLLMIAPSALFGCMSAVERGYYEGLQNMYPTAMSQAIEAIIKVICGLCFSKFVLEHESQVLLFFPNGTDILSVAAAAAVFGVTVSTAGGLFYFFFRNLLGGDGFSRSSLCAGTIDSRRHIAKRLMITMLPITLGSVGATLTSIIDLCTIMRCIDFSQEHDLAALINRFGDIAADKAFPAFVYGAFTGMALTVFNLVPSITNMYGRSVLPCAARACAKGKTESLREQVRSVLFAAGLIAVPSGIGLIMLADPIMLALYSEHTEEASIAANALAALSPGMVFLCLVTPLFSIMQGIGRADLPVKLMLVGVAVKLLGNLLLIPSSLFAETGAGISTSVCYGIMMVLSLISLRHELKGNLRIIKTMLPIVYASLMSGGVVYILKSVLHSYNVIVQLAGCISGAVLIYGIVLWLMGHSRKNIREMLSFRI